MDVGPLQGMCGWQRSDIPGFVGRASDLATWAGPVRTVGPVAGEVSQIGSNLRTVGVRGSAAAFANWNQFASCGSAAVMGFPGAGGCGGAVFGGEAVRRGDL